MERLVVLKQLQAEQADRNLECVQDIHLGWVQELKTVAVAKCVIQNFVVVEVPEQGFPRVQAKVGTVEQVDGPAVLAEQEALLLLLLPPEAQKVLRVH